MPDYSNGKIYTIRCKNNPSIIYVGSTIQSLAKRLGNHKQMSVRKPNILLYKTINNNWNEWYIELYELFSCNTKEELFKKEGEIIRLIGNLNEKIAGRTSQQNRLDNIELFKEKDKQYYINNAEKIKEYHKDYSKKNKELIKEKQKQYRLDNIEIYKEKDKNYYDDNKDKILEKKREYNKIIKERQKEYNKQYYEKNKEKIKEQTKQYRESKRADNI